MSTIKTWLAPIPLALMIGSLISPAYSQSDSKTGEGQKGTSAAPIPPGVTAETLAREKAAHGRGTNSSEADAMQAQPPTTTAKNKGP